jgi:adenine phosphoribosyltransferase
LDEKDQQYIRGKRVVIVDDVISTGSTLLGMENVIVTAEGKTVAIAAVFTEGDADWSNIIALRNLPVFFE